MILVWCAIVEENALTANGMVFAQLNQNNV